MRYFLSLLLSFSAIYLQSQTAEIRETRTAHTPKYDGEYGLVMPDLYQYYIINDSTVIRTLQFHGDKELFADTLNLSQEYWWNDSLSCAEITTHFSSKKNFVYCAMDSSQFKLPALLKKKSNQKATQNWFLLLTLGSIALFWKKLFPVQA